MNVALCNGISSLIGAGFGEHLAEKHLVCNGACARVCVCVRAQCGRRFVNGALTSRVTSLITSLTFSQMSFLCD